MERKAIFTLLGVVCLVAARQGEDAPMGPAEGTPEVVLQLKYEEGELNRIYVTQFRKALGLRPVPAEPALCAGLCHAGLGGESCGASCTEMLPVGLAAALRSDNGTTAQYGEPRVQVCPALCANKLGKPLCNCPEDVEGGRAVDWAGVCAAFCLSDGYVLGGCPVCKEVPVTTAPAALASMRLLNTSEGWVSWCNVQCRQGLGGAACNCDRAPFQ